MSKLFKTPEEKTRWEEDLEARLKAKIDALQAERDKKLENLKSWIRREISKAVVARKHFINLGPYYGPFADAVVDVANEEGSWVVDIQFHSANFEMSRYDPPTEVLLKLAVAPKLC